MLTYSEPIRKLKNKYIGQRCFLMGNGPSLNKTRLELLMEECVWGFNKIYRLFDRIAWRPKFYVTNDQRLTQNISKEINVLINQLHESTFFFPDYFFPKEVNNNNGNVYWYHEIPFNSQNCSKSILFSLDPSKYIVNTSTVTIAGLQLAAYLGFNPIYLIGCDTSYSIPTTVNFENENTALLISTLDDDTNHFSNNYSGIGDKWSVPNVPLMVTQYMEAKKALEATNVKVFNATVGGELEVFPRVDFESLFIKSPKSTVHSEI